MRISDWSSDVCSSDLGSLQNWSNSEESPAGQFEWRIGWDVNVLHRSRLSRSCVRWRYWWGAARPRWKPADRLGSSNRRCIAGARNLAELGRASCRERVCHYGEMSVVAVYLQQKKLYQHMYT